MNSIASFSLNGELNSILDNVFERATAVPGNIGASIKGKIKSAVTSLTEDKVNAITGKIVEQINGMPCSGGTGRNLLHETMEVMYEGSQRTLQNSFSFAALSGIIRDFDGVTQCHSGFFAARKEVAIDIELELEADFDTSEFELAFLSVLGDLSYAQEMFNVSSSDEANVADLFASANAMAQARLALSFGFKIPMSLTDFFAPGTPTSDADLGSLFFRIDTLSVKAKASAANLEAALFNGVFITGGDLFIELGMEGASPFEAELTLQGDLQSGMGFSNTLNTQVDFAPSGAFSTNLPFSVELLGVNRTMTILAFDPDLFDEDSYQVNVDFDACQLQDVIQILLSKLGNIDLFVDDLLGSVQSYAGMSFFDSSDDAINSLATLFPDVNRFFNGILEGKQGCRDLARCTCSNVFLSFLSSFSQK